MKTDLRWRLFVWSTYPSLSATSSQVIASLKSGSWTRSMPEESIFVRAVAPRADLACMGRPPRSKDGISQGRKVVPNLLRFMAVAPVVIACGDECPPGEGLDAEGTCRLLAFEGGTDDGSATSETDEAPSTDGDTDEPGGSDSDVPDDGLPTSPSTTFLGNISFYTPESMQQFCAKFDRVYGDVSIAGPLVDDDVHFDCLEEVQGYLSVTETRWTSWHLRGLRVVGRNLSISSNDRLASFAPSQPLVVGGDVSFQGSPDLADLSLADLTVRGGLTLSAMDGLTSFAMSQADPMRGPLNLTSCGALRSIDLSGVQFFAEQVTIAGMSALEDLDLGGVYGETPYIQVYSNPLLGSVSLGGLSGRVETASVFANPELEQIDLGGVSSLGALSVFSNGAALMIDLRALETLSGSLTVPQTGVLRVDSLRDIGQDLSISSTQLVDLASFASVRTVGGRLSITSNDLLTSVTGLAGIESVSGDVDISWNDLLGDAAAQALVDAIGEENIGGTVTVRGN